MTKFIPRDKLSKKARKLLDAEQRTTWAFSPVTKKVESKKLYNRKKKSHTRYDDYGMGFFINQYIAHNVPNPVVEAIESRAGFTGGKLYGCRCY